MRLRFAISQKTCDPSFRDVDRFNGAGSVPLKEVSMELEKKIRLPHGGRIVGSATDFLQLSPEEASLIELKLALATGVRELRERNGLTQTEVAAKLGSS
jgi:hypothetical protein